MNNKKLLQFKNPIDYETEMAMISKLSAEFDFISVSNLGNSIFGKEIPCIRIGRGAKNIVYVGAHHGMEWITTALLLKFTEEFCHTYRKSAKAYNYPVEYMFESRSLYIVPMLNPDGVDISINKYPPSGLLDERLIRMNGGSSDFSRWQANGRGVDLNHNYNAGFAEYKRIESENGIFGGAPTRYSGEYPESEPEVAAITKFIRSLGDVRLLIAFHSQGKEIYWSYNGISAPGAYRIAKHMADLSGYKVAEAEGMSSYGGMKDWFILEYNRPGFTIECGCGKNPLPIDDLNMIYASLREVMFTAPFIL